MLSNFDFVLGLNLVTSSLMTCLIWFVQVVHYPSFKYIDKKEFIKFELFHQKRISLLVIPISFFELVSSLMLIAIALKSFSVWVSGFLFLFFLIFTFLESAPIHGKLARGYDTSLVERLIKTNWIRTIALSFRFLILIVLFFG